MTALNPEPPAVTQPEVTAEASPAPQNTDPNLAQSKTESPQQTAEQPKNAETPEDPNWRAFREARKQDRAAKEAAERKAIEKEAEVAALKAAMEAAFSAKQSPSPQAYQQYYGMNHEQSQEETEEQRIERKVNELLSKKEEQYKREQADYEKQELPNRLKREFPDFGHVCSQENLDYLDYHYPELSRPLQRLPDGYDKWSDIYHAVKKFIPNHANTKKDAARADINAMKPRSIASTGPSPTGEKTLSPQHEIEARRAENWARMQRTLKGLS